VHASLAFTAAAVPLATAANCAVPTQPTRGAAAESAAAGPHRGGAQ
jgi:hypothetical protein